MVKYEDNPFINNKVIVNLSKKASKIEKFDLAGQGHL
jgi:hypothetical protein